MVAKFASFYSVACFASVRATKAFIQNSDPLFGKVSSDCQIQNITATLSSLVMLWGQSRKKFQNEEREGRKEGSMGGRENENVFFMYPKI